ncbi:hypothetical protein [Nostoc sp.]|uniref:hypothetical protein n=1 Tax=Nostoc sp. TaxID=1180 RepID=UPI002FEFA344
MRLVEKGGYANGGNRRSTPVPLSGGTPPTDWLDFALFTPPCTSTEPPIPNQ